MADDRDALMGELTDAGVYSAPDLHPQEIADAVLRSEWLAAKIRQAKAATLHDVIGLINYAREEGETDLRQVRSWVEALIAGGDA